MIKSVKKYAMFNRDKHGTIVGFCNDSFCMSYRYNCVHIWNYPPTHYFNPQKGDFIICLNRQYDDIRVLPLISFKGNYLFEQITENGEWKIFPNIGKANIE